MLTLIPPMDNLQSQLDSLLLEYNRQLYSGAASPEKLAKLRRLINQTDIELQKEKKLAAKTSPASLPTKTPPSVVIDSSESSDESVSSSDSEEESIITKPPPLVTNPSPTYAPTEYNIVEKYGTPAERQVYENLEQRNKILIEARAKYAARMIDLEEQWNRGNISETRFREDLSTLQREEKALYDEKLDILREQEALRKKVADDVRKSQPSETPVSKRPPPARKIFEESSDSEAEQLSESSDEDSRSEENIEVGDFVSDKYGQVYVVLYMTRDTISAVGWGTLPEYAALVDGNLGDFQKHDPPSDGKVIDFEPTNWELIPEKDTIVVDPVVVGILLFEKDGKRYRIVDNNSGISSVEESRLKPTNSKFYIMDPSILPEISRKDLLEKQKNIGIAFSKISVGTNKRVPTRYEEDWIKNFGNLTKVHINGDGNCQFSALSYALYGSPQFHALLRKKIAEYMSNNRRNYFEAKNDNGGQKFETFNEYIECLSKSECVWGNSSTLQAASDLFGITIYVFQRIDGIYQVYLVNPRNNDAKYTIYIANSNENHFDAIDPILSTVANSFAKALDADRALLGEAVTTSIAIATLLSRARDSSEMEKAHKKLVDAQRDYANAVKKGDADEIQETFSALERARRYLWSLERRRVTNAPAMVIGPAQIASHVPHVRSSALDEHIAAGNSALSLRLHFNYEADLAGGAAHQFASEREPVLHVFATQGLGILNHKGDDDGVVVVDTATIAAQKATLPTKSILSGVREEEGVVYYDDIVDSVFGGDFSIVKKDPLFSRESRLVNRIKQFIGTAVDAGAFQRATVADDEGNEIVDESRTSESVAISPTYPSSQESLADAIRREIAEAVFGDVRLAAAVCPGDDAYLQIQRYGAGGQFDLHHDSIVFDDDEPFPEQEAAPGDRLFTVFVYLNDGFSGGSTNFPEADEAIYPKKNTAAAWPNYRRNENGRLVADERAIHSASPIVPSVSATYKYGMNVWFCLTPGVLEVRDVETISDDDDDVITIDSDDDAVSISEGSMEDRVRLAYLKAEEKSWQKKLAVAKENQDEEGQTKANFKLADLLNEQMQLMNKSQTMMSGDALANETLTAYRTVEKALKDKKSLNKGYVKSVVRMMIFSPNGVSFKGFLALFKRYNQSLVEYLGGTDAVRDLAKELDERLSSTPADNKVTRTISQARYRDVTRLWDLIGGRQKMSGAAVNVALVIYRNIDNRLHYKDPIDVVYLKNAIETIIFDRLEQSPPLFGDLIDLFAKYDHSIVDDLGGTDSVRDFANKLDEILSNSISLYIGYKNKSFLREIYQEITLLWNLIGGRPKAKMSKATLSEEDDAATNKKLMARIKSLQASRKEDEGYLKYLRAEAEVNSRISDPKVKEEAMVEDNRRIANAARAVDEWTKKIEAVERLLNMSASSGDMTTISRNMLDVKAFEELISELESKRKELVKTKSQKDVDAIKALEKEVDEYYQHQMKFEKYELDLHRRLNQQTLGKNTIKRMRALKKAYKKELQQRSKMQKIYMSVNSGDNLQSAEPRMEEICIDIPFNPSAAQRAKVDANRLWALPGARSRQEYTVPDSEGRWTIPADASVSFNAYAETATQHGQVCRTRAGEALMLVSDLLKTTPSTEDCVRAEWQITGDTPLVKGFVDVRYAELVHHLPSGESHVVNADAFFKFAPIDAAATAFHEYDADPAAKELAAKTATELGEAVNASLNVFFGSGAPLSVSKPASLRRMHCPYYNTTAGLLWGSTYALPVPRSPPPHHFYDKVLDVTLLRNDAKAEHVMAAVSAQLASPTTLMPSTRYVAKLFSEMLTVYANAMVYLDDFTNSGGNTYVPAVDANQRDSVQRVRLVHRDSSAAGSAVNVVEDYKNARLGHADDCEGVAKEIYTHFWDFRRAELDASSSPLLHHLQTLARNNVYVPALVLAAVTNKKLDTAAHDLSDEEAMAHTYTAFIKTPTFLERLSDGNNVSPLLAPVVKKSSYAQGYKAEPWHAVLDDVLVGEGTARSSAFVRPTTSYYPEEEHASVTAAAEKRFDAISALVSALPMNIVQIEIPNRRVSDDNGAIARDEADVSDFYKANSAMYVSAFRDQAILDFAFAESSAQTDSGLTHGVRFTRFSAPKWAADMKVVPYNQLSERHGALADAILSQLEPIPPLRRDEKVADEVEAKGPPASLLAVEDLFDKQGETTGVSTAVLLDHPERMPAIPQSVVVTLRAEDIDDAAAHAIVQAVSEVREHFSGARVHTHYLSAAPVRGDETSLPPVVLYDVELRLK